VFMTSIFNFDVLHHVLDLSAILIAVYFLMF